jgi:hypothetical protein
LRQTTQTFLNNAIVPTDLERLGDFSQSRTIPTDPASGQPFACNGVTGVICSNRREDGTYNAYNLLDVKDGEVGVDSLYLMLEGQVAAGAGDHLELAGVLQQDAGRVGQALVQLPLLDVIGLGVVPVVLGGEEALEEVDPLGNFLQFLVPAGFSDKR